jgi:N12 class adenine-specific DNA methylase
LAAKVLLGWEATFGEPVTAMELAPARFRLPIAHALCPFISVPELMQMFGQAADIQTKSMLKLLR